MESTISVVGKEEQTGPVLQSNPAFTIAGVCLVAAGVLLRVREYLVDRSLWLDEASLALNLIERSLPELFKPLDYEQAAPAGFLLLSKAAYVLGGASELSLRALPAFCSIMSVPLFYIFVRCCASPATGLFAMALFAFSPGLVYFSGEFKPYSVDVFCAVVLMLLILPAKRVPAAIIWTGLIAAVSFWLSSPSVFVAAGCLLFACIFSGTRRAICFAAASLCICTAAFLPLWIISLRFYAADEYLLAFWGRFFAPFPLQSPGDFKWYLTAPVEMIQYVLIQRGARSGYFGLLFFIAAVAGLLRLRRSPLAILFAAPVLFAFAASMLKLYPFGERLMLFAAPALIMLVAFGFSWILQALPRSAPLALIAALLLIMPGAGTVLRRAIDPRGKEELLPVMRYVSSSYREGQSVYVYYGAKPAYLYYRRIAGLDEADTAFGSPARERWPLLLDEIIAAQPFSGELWLVFSHVFGSGGFNERDFTVNALRSRAFLLDKHEGKGSAAYLFDLSPLQMCTDMPDFASPGSNAPNLRANASYDL